MMTMFAEINRMIVNVGFYMVDCKPLIVNYRLQKVANR